MKKIKVEICVGTTCYIMGNSEIQNLEENLPDEIKDLVEISGCTCLGLCKDENYGTAPYVKINDQTINNATTNVIVHHIMDLIKKETQNEDYK